MKNGLSIRLAFMGLAFFYFLSSECNARYRVVQHPHTGESALISVDVSYGFYATMPHKPVILAVFPSGSVIWSADYFDGERVRMAGGLPREQVNELVSIRNERLREVLDRVQGDSPELRSQRMQALTADPIVQDINSLLNEVKYFEGYVDEEVIHGYLKGLRRSGFYNSPGVAEGVTNAHRTISIVARHDGLYKFAAGPYGYFTTENSAMPSWERGMSEESSWVNLLSYVLSVVDQVDSGTVETHSLTIPKEIESTLLYSPDEIDVAFPPPMALFEEPRQPGELLATGLALAGENSPAALSYLQSALPAIPEDERYQAYRAIGYLSIRQGDAKGAESAFARIANREVNSDAVTLAEANIRMGYLAVGRGDAREAEMYFSRVALGTVPARQEQVEEAAYRFARLLHRRARINRAFGPAAADVYSQLVENAQTQKMERDARLQLTGLLFELAKGDYGPVDHNERTELLEQARAEATLLIENAQSPFEHRTIAELMYLETFYYEDKFEVTLEKGLEFLDKWSVWRDENPELVNWNINTHLITAHTYAPISAYRMSAYEQCITLAREIRELYDDGDPYDTFNSFAYSLLYEAFAQEAIGNYEAGEELRERCRQVHPDWYRTIGRRHAGRYGLPHSMLDSGESGWPSSPIRPSGF